MAAIRLSALPRNDERLVSGNCSTLVLKTTLVVVTSIPIRWENSCGLRGDDEMLKKIIAAIVLSSAVAMAPGAAFAKKMDHHHHHHHEHHHHHHHHNM